MAEIFPFRALRYDPARVQPAQVVTQPYDKITPAMQAAYYEASPYNLVRIILGKTRDGDSDADNVYSRAAADFRRWRGEGILRPDAAPSLYVYTQTFTVPGTTEQRERRGLIALGKLEPYERGVVFRHEQTLAKPRADRLNLLRATRAHFGQLFMLSSDPQRALEELLQPAGAPSVEVGDEYGVRHSLWPMSDPERIRQAQSVLREAKLIIADGHHRYETALAYREERRAADPAAVNPPWDLVMMTLVNQDSPGLVILPTHRVVFGLHGFDSDLLLRSLWGYFHIEQLSATAEAAQLTAQLAGAGTAGTAFVAVTRGGRYLLRAKQDFGSLLDGCTPRQRTLDLVRLHRVILEHVLGLSEEDIRQQRHVSYHRSAAEALERVAAGANAAFLVNPVSVQQTCEIALAGEVLPQKSTDFYPKLLSGLTIYALE